MKLSFKVDKNKYISLMKKISFKAIIHTHICVCVCVCVRTHTHTYELM